MQRTYWFSVGVLLGVASSIGCSDGKVAAETDGITLQCQPISDGSDGCYGEPSIIDAGAGGALYPKDCQAKEVRDGKVYWWYCLPPDPTRDGGATGGLRWVYSL